MLSKTKERFEHAEAEFEFPSFDADSLPEVGEFQHPWLESRDALPPRLATWLPEARQIAHPLLTFDPQILYPSAQAKLKHSATPIQAQGPQSPLQLFQLAPGHFLDHLFESVFPFPAEQALRFLGITDQR